MKSQAWIDDVMQFKVSDRDDVYANSVPFNINHTFIFRDKFKDITPDDSWRHEIIQILYIVNVILIPFPLIYYHRHLAVARAVCSFHCECAMRIREREMQSKHPRSAAHMFLYWLCHPSYYYLISVSVVMSQHRLKLSHTRWKRWWSVA